MEKITDIKLADQLCFSIYNTSRLFTKFYQKALEPYHLTYTQYIVLLALWEEECSTLNDLSKKLDLASNTLTPLLKRLETAGWLSRCRGKDDQRQLQVQLTEKGRAQKLAIEQSLENCVVDSMNGLSPETYHRMLADHHQLNQALKNYLELDAE
ncbi:MAG TPA: MarR family transcriptional regulator [Candidatus Tetragenococcus pullicola]|nr:MarR family transcriptional regulator [Candidatus Tetragenococcus pullicola]